MRKVLRFIQLVIPSVVEGYVLDKEGKIVFVTSGAYTEDKMDEIDEHIE